MRFGIGIQRNAINVGLGSVATVAGADIAGLVSDATNTISKRTNLRVSLPEIGGSADAFAHPS